MPELFHLLPQPLDVPLYPVEPLQYLEYPELPRHGVAEHLVLLQELQHLLLDVDLSQFIVDYEIKTAVMLGTRG